MRRLGLAVLALATAGCGHYGDFTLPPAAGSAGLPSIQLDPEPVLRAGPGSFDSHDALNPSVVERGGILYNFYSGYDGKVWRTALATAGAGGNWEKHGAVLAPDVWSWESDYIAANGSALVVDGAFWYWYQAGDHERPQIGLARSEDGRSWRKEPAPVLTYGPYLSWDEQGVADPYVLRTGSWFYLYYLGQDRAKRQQLGVARSRDGVHWEKLRGNPVLRMPLPDPAGRMEENGLGEPAVFAAAGRYWMLYTGRDRSEHRALALASSPDGVNWRREPAILRGGEAWNRAVLCDPTVLVSGGTVRLWFGGGDEPRPDENLHGAIGTGTMVWR